LLIFAVLGLLSACDNFTPYEPVGVRLSLEEDTLIVDYPFKVTVLISSKTKDSFVVTWNFYGSDGSVLPETKCQVTTDSGETFADRQVITKTTTLTFTVSEVASETTIPTKLIIQVLNEHTVECADRREVTISNSLFGD
jgi:hypothetical protein